MAPIRTRLSRTALLVPAAAAGVLVLAGCGGSSGGPAPASSGGSTPSTSKSPAPSTMFSTANVSGLGQVLVDSRGRTVYVLTKDGKHNVPCTDATGCTNVWPDLPLPDGQKPQAGSGVQASMLKAAKNMDGETYPTYNGWLMYEYAADTGPAQSNGQGIQSFGGTWYALSPSGKPVTAGGSNQSSGGGYHY